jgi:hypothetical protein
VIWTELQTPNLKNPLLTKRYMATIKEDKKPLRVAVKVKEKISA